MLVGIVSDTHSNPHTTRRALEILAQRQVECILHCGDICDPATVRMFSGIPTHFVLGNNDHDVPGLQQAAKAVRCLLHGEFADLQLAGCRIAMLHGDDFGLLERTIAAGQFSHVFFGHTHEYQRNHTAGTIVLNPGALHRARPKSFVIMDLATGTEELIKLQE